MSIISKIPDNSRVRYPVARFQSAGLDGLGQYEWGTAGNKDVPLMDSMRPTSVYLIERVSFFANVLEGTWLESMLTPDDFPRISIKVKGVGGQSIFGDPFRCVNYVDNNEQLLYLQCVRPGDQLVATMYGKVLQVPAMAGMLNLLSEINFTAYEITDKDWVTTYMKNPGRLGLTLRV